MDCVEGTLLFRQSWAGNKQYEKAHAHPGPMQRKEGIDEGGRAFFAGGRGEWVVNIDRSMDVCRHCVKKQS